MTYDEKDRLKELVEKIRAGGCTSKEVQEALAILIEHVIEGTYE